MDTPVKEYLPEGHLHAHAYLTLIRVAVSHLIVTPSASLKVNNRQSVGRVLAESQKVMAEASYLAPLISEPVRLKLILGMALYADPGTGRGEIQEQLGSATLLALDTIKRQGRFVFPP